MSLKNHLAYLVPSIALVLFVTSCQKKDETEPQPAKVVIEVVSPKPAEIFKKGDSIHINANISYISQLHGYEIRITNNTTGKVVGEFEGHTHSDKVTIAETWLDTVSEATKLKVSVIAIIDHSSSATTKEIEIESQP